MYRHTINNKEDIETIVNIYNNITGRSRTVELHRWEWFESPFENKSYVIINKDGDILGHHGILSVKLNYKGKTYSTGKTENTIMKKGYGPLYFKNEMAMHNEYISNYDILITTTAHGVTKKIREKLGYKVFSNYVSYIKIVDFNALTFKIKNKVISRSINIFAPIVNVFLFKSKTNNKLIEKIASLQYADLEEIEIFYNRLKNDLHFSQERSRVFLEYRVLNNPYNEYFLLKLYSNNKLSGYVMYSVSDKKLQIEDILFEEKYIFQELLNRLYNHTKENKLAYTISFLTLENSILDKKPNGYLRKVHNNKGSNKFMLKNNIIDENKDELKVENFYLTKLFTEGIS